MMIVRKRLENSRRKWNIRRNKLLKQKRNNWNFQKVGKKIPCWHQKMKARKNRIENLVAIRDYKISITEWRKPSHLACYPRFGSIGKIKERFWWSSRKEYPAFTGARQDSQLAMECQWRVESSKARKVAIYQPLDQTTLQSSLQGLRNGRKGGNSTARILS